MSIEYQAEIIAKPTNETDRKPLNGGEIIICCFPTNVINPKATPNQVRSFGLVPLSHPAVAAGDCMPVPCLFRI